MYKIPINLLDLYRAFRLDLIDMPLEDLISIIRGTYKPIPVMTIDQLIYDYFLKGTTKNEAFTLNNQEVEQLSSFHKQIFDQLPLALRSPDLLQLKLSGDIIITGNIPILWGAYGADLKVGMDFINNLYDHFDVPAINIYEMSLRWKFFMLSANLVNFQLFVITYSDYRPYKFELASYDFYAYPLMAQELKDECDHLIQYCKANKLDKCITI